MTLQDVANASGFSINTVSNVIRGTGSLAPTTREKILQVASEINYIPNSAAKALATGRTGLIAVMCGSVHEWYCANMVAYLEKCLGEDHYQIILVRRPGELQELLSAVGGAAIDGAIAINMNPKIDDEARAAPSRHKSLVPCVAVGTYAWTFIDSVVIDLKAAVTSALDQMLAARCRRIAYVVTHSPMASPQEDHAKAYLTRMESARQTPEIINLDTDNLTEVKPKLSSYIRQNGCPDALLCQNDEVAMSAYRAVRDLKYHVPADVLIIGCDGQLPMRYFDPPLSTIAQPLEDVCQVAWRFLKQRIATPSLPRQHTVLEGELVIRHSMLRHKQGMTHP